MSRRGGTSVSLDAPLDALLTARRRSGLPCPPLSALTRVAARAWLAEQGVPCPPEPPGDPRAQTAAANEARRKKNEEREEGA